MDEKKSFVFYDEWFEYLEDLDAEELASFVENLRRLRSGDETNESSKAVRLLLKMVRQQLRRDADKYEKVKEKRTESLKKANRAKANATADAQNLQMQENFCECTQDFANAVQMGAVNVNDNVNDNVNGSLLRKDINTPPISPLKGDGCTGERVKEEGFEEFWKLYPRKVDKKKARTAWNKIPHKLYQCIFSNIVTMAASEEWRKGGGRYVPHPSTYLNGARWEDEGQSSIPSYVLEKL